MKLIDDIKEFLEANGFECSVQMRNGFDMLCITTFDGHHNRVILPLKIAATSPEEAEHHAEEAHESIRMINSYDGEYPMIVTQDRWNRQREMMKRRILAHLELFSPIYARNCEIRRIDKTVAKEFLERAHSYGHAACRYCYGMFLKRHTGHMAGDIVPGTLVAVATFSNARKWIKGDRTVRSYEWIRYASLPEARISGGMGRLLKHFIKEVRPDDIMTYADLEWSKGDVYMRLGFVPEGKKTPVLFTIDDNWQRFPVKPGMTDGSPDGVIAGLTGNLYFRNFGSNKFRLKLTDYE